MDKATREFLIWVDGYCENIEAVPTEKQWKRFMGKIAELAELAKVEPEIMVPAPLQAAGLDYSSPVRMAPDVALNPNAQPTDEEIAAAAREAIERAASTPRAVAPSESVVRMSGERPTRNGWMMSYRLKMKELGIDASDLDDVVKLATFNPDIDARRQAAADFNQMYKGANAA